MFLGFLVLVLVVIVTCGHLYLCTKYVLRIKYAKIFKNEPYLVNMEIII